MNTGLLFRYVLSLLYWESCLEDQTWWLNQYHCNCTVLAAFYATLSTTSPLLRALPSVMHESLMSVSIRVSAGYKGIFPGPSAAFQAHNHMGDIGQVMPLKSLLQMLLRHWAFLFSLTSKISLNLKNLQTHFGAFLPFLSSSPKFLEHTTSFYLYKWWQSSFTREKIKSQKEGNESPEIICLEKSQTGSHTEGFPQDPLTVYFLSFAPCLPKIISQFLISHYVGFLVCSLESSSSPCNHLHPLTTELDSITNEPLFQCFFLNFTGTLHSRVNRCLTFVPSHVVKMTQSLMSPSRTSLPTVLFPCTCLCPSFSNCTGRQNPSLTQPSLCMKTLTPKWMPHLGLSCTALAQTLPLFKCVYIPPHLMK